MKKLTLSAILCTLLLVSCGTEQEKALKSIGNNPSLEELRSFAATYPEMEEKVKEAYDNLLAVAVEDSTLFSAIDASKAVLERYSLSEEYLGKFPNGNHYSEVVLIHEQVAEKAETISEVATKLSEGLSKYHFLVDADMGNYDWSSVQDEKYTSVVISDPLSTGEGTFDIKFPIKFKQSSAILDLYARVHIKGTYLINDEGLILVNYAYTVFNCYQYINYFQFPTEPEEAMNEDHTSRALRTESNKKARIEFNYFTSDPLDRYRMRAESFSDESYIQSFRLVPCF